MTRDPSRRVKPPSVQSSQSAIPAPFTKTSPTLDPFLNHLDRSQVYITHIDRHPPAYKRQIFTIPVLLNFTVALLLAWRAWHAVPTYWKLVQTVFGVDTGLRVNTAAMSRGAQVMVVLRRTAMMFMDFLLYRFMGPWPVTFFLEVPANPVVWRWRIGFRKEELVVRMSRGWGAADLMEGVKRGEENAFFKTRVLPAIGKAQMAKTGYLMMDRSWDLDFEYMLMGQKLVERKEVAERELDGVVFVHLEGAGWVGWRWDTGSDVIEARRKKVVAFKEKLTALGKESLFWRWTEIVEKERDADGGFTKAGQEKVVTKVRDEFEKEGVDFEEVVESIGGLEEVPADP